jgi:hypothetical protein
MTITERNGLNAYTDTNTSGVSWAAVLAGAAAAAALSLILLVLGIGLGFSTISPWSNKGVSVSAIGTSTIVWLILTQIAASGIGGYLAGRLRIKWASVHNDEVYFRDTAHGFLAWAIASLAAAVLLSTVTANVVSGGVSATASVAGSAAGVLGIAGAAAAGDRGMQSPGSAGSRRVDDGDTGYLGYTIDSLFRSSSPAADAGGAAAGSGTAPTLGIPGSPTSGLNNANRAEVLRIFANALHSNSLPTEDQQYLAQLVAQRTGLSVADANKRVADAFNRTQAAVASAEQNAKEAADKARKAVATSALWMFVALLCGAFFASLAATFGGRQRDNVIHIGSPA